MSIFNLKTSPEELKSSNYGVSDFKYVEYTPSRDVTNDNFPNGAFRIPFQLSSEQWWIPSRSYMRLRCNLNRGDGQSLTLANKVAPNMNIAANLFQSMELQLNGKTLSRCSDHVAEIDTLEQRLHKSKSWMDSIGASINWLQESVDDRINQVSSNGSDVNTDDMDYVCDWKDPDFGLDEYKAAVKTNVIGVLPAAGNSANLGETYMTINNTTGAKGPINQARVDAFNAKVKDGDYIVFTNGDDQTAARCYSEEKSGVVATLDGTVMNIRCTLGPNREGTGFVTVAAPNTPTQQQFIVKRPKPSRRITGFEVIWKPMCLSVFKYSGALPTGKFELICTPHNASGDNYKIRAIECPTYLQTAQIPKVVQTSTADTVKPTTYEFKVEDCRFFAAQVVGERVEDMSYYLDLENTNVRKSLLQTTNSLSKTFFELSPTTYGITVGFQDINAGIDPRRSPSRFTVADVPADTTTGQLAVVSPELKLNRMFLQYAGKSFPQPDADPSFKLGTSANDYTTQRYIETSINTGAYFSEGGGESIQDWQKRGCIHYFSTPKDAQDRSTRATINTMFSAKFDNKANLVVWDHFKSAAKVTIQRGMVTEVELIDV